MSFSCWCEQGPKGDAGDKGESGRNGDPVSLSSSHTLCIVCFLNFSLSDFSLSLGSARIDGPSGAPRVARQCGAFLNIFLPFLTSKIQDPF